MEGVLDSFLKSDEVADSLAAPVFNTASGGNMAAIANVVFHIRIWVAALFQARIRIRVTGRRRPLWPDVVR